MTRGREREMLDAGVGSQVTGGGVGCADPGVPGLETDVAHGRASVGVGACGCSGVGTNPVVVVDVGRSVDEDCRGRDSEWAPVECTLPAGQRPARMAEFDELLAGARSLSRPGPTRLRLVLDRAYEVAARDLLARESACCSFFTFTVAELPDGGLRLEVIVPREQVSVLDGAAKRAGAAGGRGR